ELRPRVDRRAGGGCVCGRTQVFLLSLAPASLGVPARLFREDGVTQPTGQQLYEALHRHASELAAAVTPAARGDAAPAAAPTPRCDPASAPEGGGRERILIEQVIAKQDAIIDRLDRMLALLEWNLLAPPCKPEAAVEIPHHGKVR